ncbi:MAG: hypothetical protein R2942_11640 [Ignavibacteria bacterium]
MRYIILSGNILTNTINTRDVGANAGAGMVKNLNTLQMYCSIQAANSMSSDFKRSCHRSKCRNLY